MQLTEAEILVAMKTAVSNYQVNISEYFWLLGCLENAAHAIAEAEAEKKTILKQATSMMIALRQVSGVLWKIYDTLMDEGMQHDRSEIERRGRLLAMEGIDAISGVLKADALEDKQPCGHERRFVVSTDEGTNWCALCELQGVRASNEALLDKMIISLREETTDETN